MLSSERSDRSTIHFFTVDVEEYFHVNAFESVISREDWPLWPKRLDRSVPELLDVMARHGARGTFFVLGWVAEQSPEIVRLIADAGHEIASHGHWHRRIPGMTPTQFREDLRSSKTALENVIGASVLGFRAPSFSILPGFEWAFDVLLEEGFRYDSSLFPIRRRGYGNPNAKREPHLIHRAAGVLAEFPLATTLIAGFSWPAAGGGYLRHLPLGLMRRAFGEADARGTPATFYIHPWEIDPGQPRVDVSALTRLRHYRGLSRTLGRLESILSEFRFGSIASYLDRFTASASPTGASIASP